MPLSLTVRLLFIAAVALAVAAIDWGLKAWALEALRPDQIVFNVDRTWHYVVVCAVIGAGLVAVARTRLLALGAGVVIGGGLGNMAELAVFGRVTDFIPLGVPFRGAVWSPADFFLAVGLVVLWAGAVRAPGVPSVPMHYKRVIPCMDVDAGRVVKGTQFLDIRDAGDPVELAAFYDAEGADELVFLDITATSDKRETVVELARRAADEVFIPFTIGGGIRSAGDAQAVLDAGADKVSVNSAAVARPELIDEMANVFGAQCVVLAIDAKRAPEGWEVYVAGGRTATGIDAVSWAREGVSRGAGEILLTSMDRDGTQDGYDTDLAARDLLAGRGAGHRLGRRGRAVAPGRRLRGRRRRRAARLRPALRALLGRRAQAAPGRRGRAGAGAQRGLSRDSDE